MDYVASSERWIPWANAVGDFNTIHREKSSAQSYGLPGIIAPGMYNVSHMARDGDVTQIENILFRDKVLDDSDISVVRKDRRKGALYEFFAGDKKVCRASGVRFDELNDLRPLGMPVLHTAYFNVSEDAVRSFQESVFSPVNPEHLGMYMACLSGPALLDYGKTVGVEGIHATQSFSMHAKPQYGEVRMIVGNPQEKGDTPQGKMMSFGLWWVQDHAEGGNLIATGESGLILLNKRK